MTTRTRMCCADGERGAPSGHSRAPQHRPQTFADALDQMTRSARGLCQWPQATAISVVDAGALQALSAPWRESAGSHGCYRGASRPRSSITRDSSTSMHVFTSGGGQRRRQTCLGQPVRVFYILLRKPVLLLTQLWRKVICCSHLTR